MVGLVAELRSRRVMDTPPQSTVLAWWEKAEGLIRAARSTSVPWRIWMRSAFATGIGLAEMADGGTGAGMAVEREKEN